MYVEIINQSAVCPQTNESITLERLNVGLTNFYGKKVEITNENLKDFEGDILALCFGFN